MNEDRKRIQPFIDWLIDNKRVSNTIVLYEGMEAYLKTLKQVKNHVVLDNVSKSVRQEIERRRDLIINEPNGIVRETMISNLAIDL